MLSAVLVLAACGDDAASTGRDGGTCDATVRDAAAGTDGSARDADARDADAHDGAVPEPDADGVDAGAPRLRSASLVDRRLVCKLINGAHLDDPTANRAHFRFNLRGTDLGVPLVTGSTLHLFFGDTVGFREIWDFGQDPDSVAHIPVARVEADAAALCAELDFYVTPDVPSVAADTDARIERDFAGAYMSAPAGEPLSRYIAQPPPGFPQLPGTFEVPSGAVAIGGAAYVYYAGAVELSPRTRATLSFLAEWSAPGGAVPGYQILFPVDELSGGELGGRFIQIAPVVHGDALYLFGTGDYRRSGIYLAREPVAHIRERGGHEIYDPSARAWVTPGSAVAPLVETGGVGELSVQHVAEAALFVLVYQREQTDAGGGIVDNRVIARVAEAPEGPWSDPVTIADMGDGAFRTRHCCGSTCTGEQILHCERAGLYGVYALPTIGVTAGPAGTRLTIPLLASTWDPYNVVLFTVELTVAP